MAKENVGTIFVDLRANTKQTEKSLRGAVKVFERELWDALNNAFRGVRNELADSFEDGAKLGAKALVDETRQELNYLQEEIADNIRQGFIEGSASADLTTQNTTGSKKSSFDFLAFTSKLYLIKEGVELVGRIGSEFLELGSDLSEVQNVVDTVFPSMRDELNSWSTSLVDTHGISETMAKQFSGVFGTMANAMGIAQNESYEMATSLTELSGDVASFYNLSQEEAYEKLKGIFTGESEALKSLGVIMTQTALNQYAMNQGWGKTTAKMTEQEKVMLRYQYVMSSLGAAQGDFAKTSEGWANQTRILSVQFEQLKATVGQGLINALTPTLKVINTLLAKLQTLATAFAELTGDVFGVATTEGAGTATEGLDSISSGLDGVTEGANSASEALGQLSIDQFNKIGDSGASAGAGIASMFAGVGGTIALPSLDTSQQSGEVGKLTKKLDEMWEKVRESAVFEDMAVDMNRAWGKYAAPLQVQFDIFAKRFRYAIYITFKQFTKPLLEELGLDFDGLWDEHIRPFFQRCMDFMGFFGVDLMEGVNKGLYFYNFFMTYFGTHLKNMFAGFFDYVCTRIGGWFDWFNGLLTFLQGVFSGDLQLILNGIHLMISGCFEKIGLDIKDKIADAINSVIRKLNEGIKEINKIFKTDFEGIPYISSDGSALAGGASRKFDIGGASRSFDVPKYANGAYVSANSPHLATVGDNKRYGEVIAPENKMYEIARQAAADAQAEQTAILREILMATRENKPVDRPIQLDGKTVTKAVNKENAKSESRKGK